MPDTSAKPSAPPLTVIQWVICATAAIGFAFDIYVILVMPLILRDVVQQLTGAEVGSPLYKTWANVLLFAPLVVGGLFGLVGGYLTDLYGRRRVLVWSILLYAGSALASGFATNAWTLLVLRCLTLAGVCVEFVAAVAWLAELFPDPLQREKVLGFTQAFSSLGGLLSAEMFGHIVSMREQLPMIAGGHEAWRYTLISGVIPAIPLIIVRPFLPESPIWHRKHQEGTLARPSFAELFRPAYRRTTIVTTLIFACGYGAAFGAIQHLPQIVPALPSPQTAALAKQIREAASEAEKKPLQKALADAKLQNTRTVQRNQELGGLVGRFALAVLAIGVLSRQSLLRTFQIPGVVMLPVIFALPATNDLDTLRWCIAFAGFCTVAQFSFWGNYLPLVYPVHLRGTGGIFAANVGGRILGTACFPLTTILSGSMPGPTFEIQLAQAAAAVGGAVFVIGLIASFWLPEPKRDALPD